MKETIQHEKYGEILYNENFWTGKKEISMNGVPLKKVSKREFETENGTKATINGNFLTGASMSIEGETIRLTSTIKWYEIVMCIVPLIFLLVWGNTVALCQIIPIVGGAIGGGISGLVCFTGLFFMRTVKPFWAKLLIALAAFAVAFGICCGIGFAILAIASL